MGKIDVVFLKKFGVCLRPMRCSNRLRLTDVQFLGEYLCCSVDEERLSRCLPVQCRNDFRFKGLSNFCCLLAQQFLHLCEGEVG